MWKSKLHTFLLVQSYDCIYTHIRQETFSQIYHVKNGGDHLTTTHEVQHLLCKYFLKKSVIIYTKRHLIHTVILYAGSSYTQVNMVWYMLIQSTDMYKHIIYKTWSPHSGADTVKSSDMWCCVAFDVLYHQRAFIFKHNLSTDSLCLKMKALCCCQMSKITNSTTQHHISEDLNP